jgi:hypothetical protein
MKITRLPWGESQQSGAQAGVFAPTPRAGEQFHDDDFGSRDRRALRQVTLEGQMNRVATGAQELDPR